MSEIVENVNEQNSAQNKEEAALPTEIVVDVTLNNVDVAVKAVPEADKTTSPAIIENNEDSGSKDVLEKASTSPKVDNKKTPVKRTPSKRMSFIERAQKESEELVKNMGGSLEIEGGRKTRSSTRGSVSGSAAVSTPPPAKKSRASPASGASTPTRPRGRGRKIDVADDATEEDEKKSISSIKKSPVKGDKDAANEADKSEVVEEKSEEGKEVEKKLEQDKPEKSCITTETNIVSVADETKETSAGSELTKEVTAEEDTTDAALDPIVEETQSQVLATDSQPTEKTVTNEPEIEKITAEVVLEISESAKSDSPMDTDIEIIEEKCQDKPEVPQPTIEPMEVDSSSGNEDDVVEIHVDADVVKPLPTSTSESGQPTTAALNNIEKITVDNSLDPPADVVANNSIEKPAAVDDVANANATISEDAIFDTNKNENDLCEPKIATSPPISASSENSSVTTPQSCN